MIGAIVLTYRKRERLKRQSYIIKFQERKRWCQVVDVPNKKELKLMFDIGLGHYLTLGAIIFTIGLVGIFLNRKNVIVLLMSIELILLAVNINLVSFSIFINDLSGQIFTLFILTVAAAEAAIGLAIIVVYFRNAGTIRVEDIEKLKG